MTDGTIPPHSADETPTSDPTALTTDALRREIAGLEKLVDTKLDAALALSAEKFHSVDKQLAAADEQRLEQKADTKAAVDAALAAQEKAITKTEGSTADQIAQLNTTVDTKVQGLERSHADLKDRVTAIESMRSGATEQRDETRAITAGQLAIFGAVMLVVVLVINIVLFLIARAEAMT